MSSAAADRRRAEAVAWLRALLRGCGGGGGGQPLPPPHASEDDLRAALADGALLCAALRRLGCDPAAASNEVGLLNTPFPPSRVSLSLSLSLGL
jgi:kinesin family protein C2/C3